VSETEDDETILIYLPTKGVPKAPVPGGVKRVCCRCTRQVWLAPSGMKVQREKAASLLCIPCYLADPEALKGRIFPLTAAQKKEIADYLREQTDALPDA
jgi:hypothetical protein